MKILVLNAGSSSLKYQLFEMTHEQCLAHGVIERVGSDDAHVEHDWLTGSGREMKAFQCSVPGQHDALTLIVCHLATSGVVRDEHDLSAVGHRVVHGGAYFTSATLINEAALSTLRQTLSLAPLHNPANLEGIETALLCWPHLPQIAVFDTAFHQTMPEKAYTYAVPAAWRQDYGVRRYGFHGTSHAYVCSEAANVLGKPLESCNFISLHLGNGCSVAAVASGQSVDTSMGLTPLEGLVMGTRSGDLDPSVPGYMQRVAGLTAAEVETVLNKESGLKALCGYSDMRDIEAAAEAGEAAAELAESVFSYRIRKYIGAYLAVLGQVDALIFTGGIGEHSSAMRQRACKGLEFMGLVLDRELNAVPGQGVRQINASSSDIAILLIPTNEELEIARSVVRLLNEPQAPLSS